MVNLVKIDGYEVVEELYYSKDFMWMRIEDGKVRIGVTDFIQKKLGTIGYIEFFARVGRNIRQTRPFGAIESSNAVLDFIAPVSGTIEQINGETKSKPQMINEDPYGKGWLLIVSPTNLKEELTVLMNFEQAAEWHKRELPKKFKP